MKTHVHSTGAWSVLGMGFGHINLGTGIGILILVDGLVTAGETFTIAGIMDVGLIAFDIFFS